MEVDTTHGSEIPPLRRAETTLPALSTVYAMVMVPVAVQLCVGCAPPRPIVPGMKPVSCLSTPILLSPFPSPPSGSPEFPAALLPSPWLPCLVPRPRSKLPTAAVPCPSPFPVGALGAAALLPGFFADEFAPLLLAFGFPAGFEFLPEVATALSVFLTVFRWFLPRAFYLFLLIFFRAGLWLSAQVLAPVLP